MIRIAVLGDIGSGKSYVAKQFGYPVFNADVEVSKLYKKSRKCYKKLKKTLPKYIVSFPIKKIEILKAIFHNQNSLEKIVKISFSQSRKTLKNCLKSILNQEQTEIDLSQRAEMLSVENFITLMKDYEKQN